MRAAVSVAAYCRVSTEKDDQVNSLEAQRQYFKEYIDRQPDWQLYQIYADEGITGTSTKKRWQFMRMIGDAQEGKFQLIITKEVSRFSRNILDTIAYTRQLKALGVGVLFMNDGISTLEPDAELRLSIMGSIAQEESRKTSSRVKWGQARQMERGVVFGRSLLGYDVKDGTMTVNPEGAELVRLIFRKYGLEKKGTSVIARELREAGYRSLTGSAEWSSSYLVKVLKNEKYVGDLVQKKTITPDYLTHAKKLNHGQEALIVIENHHEPIIDRELWNTVQEELRKRNRHNRQNTGHSQRYVFSGKIKCGLCGANFVARKKYRKDGSHTLRWACLTAAKEGREHTDSEGKRSGCNIGRLISDDLAVEMLRQAILTLKIDRRWIINNVTEIAVTAIKDEEHGTAEKLEQELKRLTRKKEDVLDAFFSEQITLDEMKMLNKRCDRQLEDLKERLDRVKQKAVLSEPGSWEVIQERLSSILYCRTESEPFVKEILEQIVIYPDKRAELILHHLPQRWWFQL